MDTFKDHYRVLRIDPTVEQADIKAAFRRLARRYHPDVAGGERAARRFAEILEAYEVLSNSDKRHQYDRVYRHQRAGFRGRRPGAGRLERVRRSASGSGSVGITVDLLGLRVSLAVDAETKRRRGR